ncbi:MAG: ornithine cyclodeaminase family protein [Deltaproteobacteria bacterium]|nr:ornithine cyclodeaminase family protein [Deltaproteobacteria bacterium]
MTWILTNDDIAQVLNVDDCLEVLEETFKDYALGDAANRPRSHSYAPMNDAPVQWYMLKTMDAVLPRYRVGGIRLTSDIVIERMVDGRMRREKPGLAPGGRWTELVFLFSVDTGELLAIMHGSFLQRIRVGATSAIAAKYVARKDSKIAALIGTGGLAGSHLEALSRLFALDEVRVFSPTPEHRQNFLEDWRAKMPFRLNVVSHPRDAIAGADIVSLVTNSLSPVLDEAWAQPGMHINSVQRGELDRHTIDRADLIVIRSADRDSHWFIGAREPEEVKFDLSDDPALRGKMQTLGGIMTGKEAGRTSAEQVTVFGGSGLGSAGLAIQLIACAARAFEKCQNKGLGYELPTELFSQDMHT